MAWETRHDRGRYYTRSRRVNGRVIREYIGSGAKGDRAALEDAARRAAQAAERAVIRAERERVQAIDAEFAALHQIVDQLTRGALLAAGFERHKRQWRKRLDEHDHPGHA